MNGKKEVIRSIEEIMELKNNIDKINSTEYEVNKRKKYYILVDVEKVGLGSQAIPYDISWSIVDKQGNVYRSKAYCVREVFNDTNRMMSAYYWSKYSKYLEMLSVGLYKIEFAHNIIKEMNEDMAHFNVDIFTAYNSNFDRKAIVNLIEELGIDRKSGV